MIVRTHIVQKGDTLWKIAKQYGIDFEELKRLNSHLSNPDYIVPGMEIILSNGESKVGVKPSTKGQQTAPIKSMDKSQKQKMTEEIKPIKEAPKPPALPEMVAPAEMIVPEQVQQPFQPITELRPEFHFDFAPQWFQYPQAPVQPVPMPMPMPQPAPEQVVQPAPQPLQIRPIIIDWPQQPIQKHESPEQPIVEKEVEFVPVPQPQYIYVPCMPQPMHPLCGCHHTPPPMPCGCDQGYPQMLPQQSPCGCESMQHVDPCGCGGQDMMPYYQPMMPDGQYFEPNYDIMQATDVPHEGATDMLPDWLKDSTEMQMTEQHVKGEFSDDMCSEKEAQIANYYHQMQHLEQATGQSNCNCGQSGFHPAMPMHQMPMMPHMYQMPYMQQMPHMMNQGYNLYPQMNESPSHNKPWLY